MPAPSATGVRDREFADAGNGAAQPHQRIPVELVGPAEVVDDLGYGLFGLRIPLVVGELVVGHQGAVAITALSSA
ncbi:MAG: hypothetical protein A2328_10655 [Bdellovibrionales bacterium RIFOXYB2_FULL_36_6]|nr:MAG: hypothetical protein A2328_10655 [Bdellovibrionales bacterium RIFOXYB2_FULL_36_6]